jgi:hypothetical protein
MFVVEFQEHYSLVMFVVEEGLDLDYYYEDEAEE